MKVGVHLPLMEFRGEGQSASRVMEAVDAARECGLDAISANDHLVFSTPWLDGLTALAAAIERSGEMTLATTVSLSVVRGPVPLAKALTALDVLSEGRLIAGVGPGSSSRDYEVVGPHTTSAGAASMSPWRFCARCCAERRPRRRSTYALPDSELAPQATGRAGYRSGSGAGAPKPVCVASRGSRMAGSPPPTTPAPRYSGRGGRLSQRSCASGTAIPTASRTGWSRCGPG